jgi:hypothetical protein
MTSLAIATWMHDPKDAMNLIVQFSKLPAGTNCRSNTTIDGVAKQLTVIMQKRTTRSSSIGCSLCGVPVVQSITKLRILFFQFENLFHQQPLLAWLRFGKWLLEFPH